MDIVTSLAARAYGAAAAAAQPRDRVKGKQADAAPIEAADDEQNERKPLQHT